MHRIRKFDLYHIPEHLRESVLNDDSILKSKTPCEFRDRLNPMGYVDHNNSFESDLEQQKKNPIDTCDVLGFFINSQHPLYSMLLLHTADIG